MKESAFEYDYKKDALFDTIRKMLYSALWNMTGFCNRCWGKSPCIG